MNKLDFLEATFKKVVRAKTKVPLQPQDTAIRCSSLPFCQVSLALSIMMTSIRDSRKENLTFMSDFYLSLGTAMHDVVQRWLARSSLLYGFFKCVNPKCTFSKVPSVTKGVGPKYCPACGKEMMYEEVTLKDKSGLKGHTDGLIPYKDGFLIFELKSIIARRLAEDKLPYYHNKVQANIYGVIAEKMGYKIYGVVLLYLSRDSHLNYKFFLIDKLNYQVYKETVRDIKTVKKAVRLGNFSKIVGYCDLDEPMGDCKFKSLCYKGDVLKHLKEYYNTLK